MKKIFFLGLMAAGMSTFTAQAQSKADTVTKIPSSQGELLEIKAKDLPAQVQNKLKGADYTGWSIATAYRNAQNTRYQVTLTGMNQTKVVWFDPKGNVMQNP